MPAGHLPAESPTLGFGQRSEDVGEDGVGPGIQLAVGQQLDRMRDVGHAGTGHAEPAGLLDGFVGERRGRDCDRRDSPAFEMD